MNKYWMEKCSGKNERWKENKLMDELLVHKGEKFKSDELQVVCKSLGIEQLDILAKDEEQWNDFIRKLAIFEPI